MIGSVSFRPLNSNFLHAALAGLACLTFAGAVRAGEGARNIEVVPFHSTSMDTNYNQPAQDDSQPFKVWQPTAPNSLKSAPPPAKLTPLPQSQQTVSREEQQQLDRRRNWVFMTPEDYATTDAKTGKSVLGADNDKDENMTAMERFYHRLEQSVKPATTNEFSDMNPDRSSSATNYFGAAVKNTDPGMFGQTPFDSTPQAGVFQSITAGNSGSVFDSSSSTMVQSPEEIRMQATQKAHMENFKQLWDIDQAISAATPVVSQPSGPVDSAPLFGTSTPGLATPFKENLPSANIPGFSSKPATPAPQPVVAPRYTAPPHSDFMPPQRAF